MSQKEHPEFNPENRLLQQHWEEQRQLREEFDKAKIVPDGASKAGLSDDFEIARSSQHFYLKHKICGDIKKRPIYKGEITPRFTKGVAELHLALCSLRGEGKSK